MPEERVRYLLVWMSGNQRPSGRGGQGDTSLSSFSPHEKTDLHKHRLGSFFKRSMFPRKRKSPQHLLSVLKLLQEKWSENGPPPTCVPRPNLHDSPSSVTRPPGSSPGL